MEAHEFFLALKWSKAQRRCRGNFCKKICLKKRENVDKIEILIKKATISKENQKSKFGQTKTNCTYDLPKNAIFTIVKYLTTNKQNKIIYDLISQQTRNFRG